MVDLQEMADRSVRNFNFWYNEAIREIKEREMAKINQYRIATSDKLYERHYTKYRFVRECEAIVAEKKSKQRIKK